jgi:hypothetical protein
MNDLPKECCPVCAEKKSTQLFYRCIDGIDYFECSSCGSILADQGNKENSFSYDDEYWKNEAVAAKERSFGSSVNRCAEVFFYSRIPINKFLDIGSGPGYLLDALSTLMPNFASMFYGVELFPPPEKYQSQHKNYMIGSLADQQQKFDGGVCIEVIEHLTPRQLDILVKSLAEVSEQGAVYYFNSGQPEYVKKEDPGYLDPKGRGHIASYSVQGLKMIFSKYGFSIIPLPGRSWGFLAEFVALKKIPDADELLGRLWNPHPENASKLKSNGFGELMYAIGLESARCYLESAIATERTIWALSLQSEKKKKFWHPSA